MGIGSSVEFLGNKIVGDDNKHIVTEGLVLASLYIGVRYLHYSITKGGGRGESGTTAIGGN